MASPGSPAGPEPASHYCSACFESRVDIPSISAPAGDPVLCTAGVDPPPDPASEVFAAADANGDLYVVKTGTNEVIVGPDFANYALWRTLCNWEAVFASPGYRGDRYIDARVQAPPDTP